MNYTKLWSDIKEKYVIYEDEHILVLNKPTGISVVGDSQGVDLITLAKGSDERLSPVHRIDKETSGAIILAKEPGAHAELTRQFNKRTVTKLYLAITKSAKVPESGKINLPLSTGRKNRVRIAVKREDILHDSATNHWYIDQGKILASVKNYPSVTSFIKAYEGNNHTLLAVKPLTGRRHQIRVHLAWIGFPIEGDPLFDDSKTAERTYLHSWKLEFDASWKNNERILVEAVPDNSFWNPLIPSLEPDEIQKVLRSIQQATEEF